MVDCDAVNITQHRARLLYLHAAVVVVAAVELEESACFCARAVSNGPNFLSPRPFIYASAAVDFKSFSSLVAVAEW